MINLPQILVVAAFILPFLPDQAFGGSELAGYDLAQITRITGDAAKIAKSNSPPNSIVVNKNGQTITIEYVRTCDIEFVDVLESQVMKPSGKIALDNVEHIAIGVLVRNSGFGCKGPAKVAQITYKIKGQLPQAGAFLFPIHGKIR